ncbi:MAG: 1-acyl-sn-glycerol-3-phosphate acyltransferase [Actinomycetota bacterium]|nr:1-acyl-sn-glycerol-3-phosphate acyltransferase [Actinomycetota bacterium]
MSRLHKPKAGFWIRLCVMIIYPLDAVLFRIRWRNLDRVPPPSAGGVLIVINHVSQIDTVLMARFVWQSGRVPRFMIKAGMLGWPVIGPIMRGAGQIPVQRGTNDASRSVGAALEALQRGEAVIIYPEGTTTKDPDSWPMQGRTGVARLVLLSPDTPVVPVGQWGADQGRGVSLRRLGRRRIAEVSVGKPMDLSSYRGAEHDAKTLREITDLIMTAVRDEVADLRGETPPREFFVPRRKYVDKADRAARIRQRFRPGH